MGKEFIKIMWDLVMVINGLDELDGGMGEHDMCCREFACENMG